MALTQSLDKLLQMIGGDAAHLHSTNPSNRARCQMKVKQLGCSFCIRAIHLKEVSNLEQYNIIRVVVLDVVVGVKVTSELSLPCLHFFIPGLLFWRKISVVSDDTLEA